MTHVAPGEAPPRPWKDDDTEITEAFLEIDEAWSDSESVGLLRKGEPQSQRGERCAMGLNKTTRAAGLAVLTGIGVVMLCSLATGDRSTPPSAAPSQDAAGLQTVTLKDAVGLNGFTVEPACSAHDACAKLYPSTTGSCCPGDDGVMAKCCDKPQPLKPAAADSLGAEALRTLDANHDGSADFHEVLAFATKKGLSYASTLSEFSNFDTNQNGTLEAKELSSALRQGAKATAAASAKLCGRIACAPGSTCCSGMCGGPGSFCCGKMICSPGAVCCAGVCLAHGTWCFTSS
mmetsp:Transcript_119273/g.338181  ORF Transcript_119273/g.338181 Transcript_119273/m.338181 type:complete len:290 (+) Transcript_119273:56-925(+)